MGKRLVGPRVRMEGGLIHGADSAPSEAVVVVEFASKTAFGGGGAGCAEAGSEQSSTRSGNPR